ncbi:nickel/cobalt transporter [Erwinia psidii]|uniref:Nickel/cobalt efflux system n=1 Tax=Erwinia psidii TaxID=69224 RepID=A0A3N6UVZ4_9GAMM|nr:nickel/cobalt transporter [Erwinia psidii]MCX8956796.1 nickel/cobalt transporter [Erwinia psidii]MCX8964425.1 nickel/cobalt transporter [Erwinia psidii]RQM40119.1 nickel/cobalt transporter [Erwinia psidii]
MSLTVLHKKLKPVGWWQAWPLMVLLALLLAAGLALWFYWPQILLQSTFWQRSLNQQMTILLQQVATHPHQAGVTLMGFSLIYGVLHALGPGHGKVVIATFLATHPTRVKTSLQLTLAAAVVQGGVAIALVTVMLGILGLSSRQLHLSSFWLEKGSYLLVVGLGGWLCWRAVSKIWRTWRSPQPLTIHRIVSAGNQHGAECGCGHHHVPDREMLDRAVSGKTKIMVVLSMGLRPCSGAIMMLLFSKVIGVYTWGVLSALVMAVGTAMTVSAMALLVQVWRSLAVTLSRNVPAARWQKVGWACLSLAGGIALMALGTMLWLTAQPAMSGGIRPVFLH